PPTGPVAMARAVRGGRVRFLTDLLGAAGHASSRARRDPRRGCGVVGRGGSERGAPCDEVGAGGPGVVVGEYHRCHQATPESASPCHTRRIAIGGGAKPYSPIASRTAATWRSLTGTVIPPCRVSW